MLKLHRILFGSIVTLKAFSLVVPIVFAEAGITPRSGLLIVLGLLMAFAGISLALGYHPKISAGCVLALGVLLIGLGVYNHHLYLLVVIACILTVGIQVDLLLKIQLTIVYGFAVLTKLNDGFLSGTELHVSMVERSPLWNLVVGGEAPAALLITLSFAALVAEGFLAIGFWFRSTRWIAAVVGIGTHGGMLILLADTPLQVVNLLVYGSLMVSMYLAFFSDRFKSPRRLSTTYRSKSSVSPTT